MGCQAAAAKKLMDQVTNLSLMVGGEEARGLKTFRQAPCASFNGERLFRDVSAPCGEVTPLNGATSLTGRGRRLCMNLL